MSGIVGMANGGPDQGRGYGAAGFGSPWPWRPVGGACASAPDRESDTRREIAAQPETLRRTERGLRGIVLPPAMAGARRLLVVGARGSLAAAVARGWIEQVSGLPCDVEPAGEWCERNALLARGTVGVLVSRSGETADVLAALAILRARGLPTVAVSAMPQSALARGADLFWPTEAGPELGLAATKSFTAHLLALLRLALAFGAARGGRLAAEPRRQAERALAEAPLACALAEAAEARLAAIGARVARAGEAIVVGSGWGAALADEAALELRQLALIHAHAAPAGNLDRGTLALLRADVPMLVLASAGRHLGRSVACAAQGRARGGYVIALAEAACCASLDQVANEVVALPGRGLAQIFAQTVAVQLVAYHAALALGHDVDRPRDLA